MDFNNLVKSLHLFERKVLPFIMTDTLFDDIVEKSGLKDVEVMRALQWLENKGLVKVSSEQVKRISLDSNGVKYKKDGLPERKIISALKDGDLSLDILAKRCGLSKDEISASIGSLKSHASIDVKKSKGNLVLGLTTNGKKLLNKEFLEEVFLKRSFPVDESVLKPEEKLAADNLKKRKKIIKVDVVSVKRVSLTPLGEQVVKSGKLDVDLIESLSSELLRSGEWKGKDFRRFDVTINVPKVFGGKKQWYRRFLDGVRQKLVGMGFEEMAGPVVESDFWDMDALFMPQFHSARDIHDAFYIKEPKFTRLDETIVKRVKEAHENGGSTGSSGWQYDFDVKRTHQQLLRTQTTACSARKLASKDLKIPGKYFAIAPCFRRDVVDATHLNNFFQVEGFVINENLTIRHLFGMLKMFAQEIAGSSEFRIMPGYFPFTEPSASLLVKHEKMGWIELGGAGIFRPELVIPLTGKNITVIAWGIGVDRLAMFKHDVHDIRTVFTHDLKYLREVKLL